MSRRPMQLLLAAVTAAVIAGTSLVLLAGAAQAGATCHSNATARSGATVAIAGLCFGPTVVYVQPRDSVSLRGQTPDVIARCRRHQAEGNRASRRAVLRLMQIDRSEFRAMQVVLQE